MTFYKINYIPQTIYFILEFSLNYKMRTFIVNSLIILFYKNNLHAIFNFVLTHF